jgi:hypothetical protein
MAEDEEVRLRNYLERIKEEATTRWWIMEGRGSYAWNDDDYRKEAGWALGVIERLAEEALTTPRPESTARIVPLYEFMGD